MQNKSHKLAILTANLKLSNTKKFECYLKEVWTDLVNRTTINKNDPLNVIIKQDIQGLRKLIFSKYYSLPGIIGDRLFRVFDFNKNGVLEYNEFKVGMNTLFCGNYEKTLRFIFDFYDFDGDGKISKEDIKVVLLYVIFSDKNLDNKIKEKEIIDINKKNDIQLTNMLDICFINKHKLIDFISFTDIVENINSDIYFLIYIFLLKQKPFSYESIELYQNKINYTSIEKINDINMKQYSETEQNFKIGKFRFLNNKINKFKKNLVMFNYYNSEANNNLNNISLKNEKLYLINNFYNQSSDGTNCGTFSTRNFSMRNKKAKSNILLNPNLQTSISSKLFDQNIKKTIYEAKLPDDLFVNIDDIKYDEEENKDDIRKNLESEKNNYSGYIYKIKNGKMIKIYFKLFYKDLFFYKNQIDSGHHGMHNLSGLFLKEEPTKILEDITYYSFSIIFPSKKHIYYCDNKTDFKNWIKYLRIATNYSNILQLYEIKEAIGIGSFSTVKKAINKVTHQYVAVKIMNKHKMNSSRLESALTEIEIMKICQFPYIIKFIDSYENLDFIFIFMEYCPGGTLTDFLKKREYTINEKLASSIIYKMCLAINYFHSYGIAHRDLKPENVLMTSDNDDADIRILDFGLGKIIGPSEKCIEPYGTIIYCAPEIILGLPYSKSVDSWSLGIITYVLLFGRIPFYHKDRIILKKYIVKYQPYFKGVGLNHVSDLAINFMQKLMIKNPDKRMTIKQDLEQK